MSSNEERLLKKERKLQENREKSKSDDVKFLGGHVANEQEAILPERVNYCNITGPVEIQGRCSSCWAFAAVSWWEKL